MHDSRTYIIYSKGPVHDGNWAYIVIPDKLTKLCVDKMVRSLMRTF